MILVSSPRKAIHRAAFPGLVSPFIEISVLITRRVKAERLRDS
jgi:hypothetical protein